MSSFMMPLRKLAIKEENSIGHRLGLQPKKQENQETMIIEKVIQPKLKQLFRN